jgi:hypothetical protein
MSETKEHELGGLAFVACMFIGAGVGLAFGRPDVGGAIGMGVGFLSMGIIHAKGVKPTPVTISIPKSFGQITLSIIGILVIVCGLCLLYNPELLYPYVAGMGVMIVGILILLGGLIGWRKRGE